MDRRTEELIATTIGVFKTRVPFSNLVIVGRFSGQDTRNGFGDDSAAQAHLIVNSMQDFRLAKKQTSSSEKGK